MNALDHRLSRLRGFGPRRLYGADLSSSLSCELWPICSRQLGVGKVLAYDGFSDLHEAALVGVASGVEPERLFIEVASDVERLDAHIRPADGTLEQGPEVLDAVGVDATAHVLVDVVNER